MRPNDATIKTVLKIYLKVKKLQLTHHIFIETKNRSYISTTVTIIRCRPYLQIKKKKNPFFTSIFSNKTGINIFRKLNTIATKKVIPHGGTI